MYNNAQNHFCLTVMYQNYNSISINPLYSGCYTTFENFMNILSFVEDVGIRVQKYSILPVQPLVTLSLMVREILITWKQISYFLKNNNSAIVN